MKKTRNERLEITVCGRPVASFENEADLMRTAAARITEWDAEAQKHANRSVELALAIGATLLAVKGKLPHGVFMLWVSQNCGSVSHTTATRYMALAEAAARRFALGEATADPAAGEEAQKEALKGCEDADRQFGHSLTKLYQEYGVVRRSDKWGGDRRKAAAENGNKVGRPAKDPAAEAVAAAADPDLSWAEASGYLRDLYRFGVEEDEFGSLADDDLESLSVMLAALTKRAEELLAARRGNGGRA